jgi:serine/threonine-protein kinase
MSDRDALLAGLLERLTGDLRSGRRPDVEGVAKEHPDVAAELRRLWGAIAVAEAMARPPRDDATTWAAAARAPAAAERAIGPEPAPTRAFGDYEILREIGRGGMGVVYEVRQRSLGRRAALKVLGETRGDGQGELARFRAEAQAAARLDHPHIVGVYEVGEVDGRPFFSMRLVEGETLAQRLSRGPLPCRDAAALLIPVARAIDYAHRQGILHRDLKPSNILIDAQGAPHVADFGLAKRIEAADASLTRSGAILGTPAYLSPEQAAGSRGRLGPETDVYGLGAVLYHAITGRPPFPAQSPVDAILGVLEEDPLPPRLLDPGIDRDLEMVVLKCLQKPTELRYASAEALARDLEAYLEGGPISVRSISLPLLLSRLFRETHHAAVLENWGLLWMWHSLVILVLCGLTNAFQWAGIERPLGYVVLWGAGFTAWAGIFWSLRRRGGPITAVERQIAHVWGASVVGSTALFLIEMALGLPVLSLSPVLPLMGASVFIAKAGILSGKFYVQAAAMLLSTLPMVLWPKLGISIFGAVSAACFFFPGLKYHRQRRRRNAAAARASKETET